MKRTLKDKSVIPGFTPTLGFTVFYLSVLVILPLATLFFKTSSLSWPVFLETVTSPRVLAACRLSFGASLIAATINAVFGLILAWVLVRYEFPCRGALDMLIDLPFALPTSVAGIALTTAFSQNGLIGSVLEPLGVKIAFTPLGIIAAMTFVGFPFVVRTVQPVLKDLEKDMEEAAMCLGAGRWQSFLHVILPVLFPAITSGFAMALARALGEYGSVVFIAGNLPMKTEIVPLLIVTKLEQYDVPGATAIASVMLLISFTLLLIINGLKWENPLRRFRKGEA